MSATASPLPQRASAPVVEAVRVVVWDLDETFWRGTLTEGGIQEYVQDHHDIVIELARRGIISSVCSKNDEADVLALLRSTGILDYLVFPSIAWTPKGPRLAQLVERLQLRPATILFIDDNPNNLAEAQAFVPGIQVAPETVIPQLLGDARFKGKDDAGLTRLAQYKLLERRNQDEQAAEGDNAAFLRGCDVRVYVEHDVAAHLDRAVELINRTNQLNFTKKRLDADPAAARAALTHQLSQPGVQAGLVRVFDRYGDYGFVGFFMTAAGRRQRLPGRSTQHLVHYCFSCRTLGMLVEQWMYDALGCPELDVVGDVLNDVAASRTVDWVREVTAADGADAAPAKIAPEIRIHGGCEAVSVAHYLGKHADTVATTGNFAAGAMFVRVNSVELLLSAHAHRSGAFDRAMQALEIPPDLLGGGFFAAAPLGTLFVVSGAYDAEAGQPRYRHRRHGWSIKLEINGRGEMNLVTTPQDQFDALLATPHFQSMQQSVAAVLRTVRTEYEVFAGPTGADLTRLLHQFLAAVPTGSRLVFMLDDDRVRLGDGTLTAASWVTAYNAALRAVVADTRYAAAVCFGDHIRDEAEIHVGGNHYDRLVYARLAGEIVALSQSLPAKPG